MKVFHGSTDIVNKPDIAHSFRPLDFGKGFYVTTVREQAEKDHGVQQKEGRQNAQITLTDFPHPFLILEKPPGADTSAPGGEAV